MSICRTNWTERPLVSRLGASSRDKHSPKLASRTTYILIVDRDPEDPQKGWGWLEIDGEVVETYNISTERPPPRNNSDGRPMRFPARKRATTKKFILRIDEHQITFRTQKVLTVKAVCAWTKTWAPSDTTVISPGGYAYNLDGDSLSSSKAHCVYFIFNRDSNAIKIGRARDITKRLKSLQTASPIVLEVMKTIPLRSEAQAKGLEGALHGKFWHLRMQGEWFKAEPDLLDYIKTGEISP